MLALLRCCRCARTAYTTHAQTQPSTSARAQANELSCSEQELRNHNDEVATVDKMLEVLLETGAITSNMVRLLRIQRGTV